MQHDPFYPQSASQIEGIAQSRKFIPHGEFTSVRKWSNTPTADVILTRYGPRGFEFMLINRLEAPWAGEWFFASGRILPGEVPDQALVRVVERELGFRPETTDIRFLLWQSIYNPECAHGGEDYFTLSACYQVWVEHDNKMWLDDSISAGRWFTKEEAAKTEFSVYVKTAIDHLRLEPAREFSLV